MTSGSLELAGESADGLKTSGSTENSRGFKLRDRQANAEGSKTHLNESVEIVGHKRNYSGS